MLPFESLQTSMTTVFIAFVVTSIALRFWLAHRHINHVKAHENDVPPLFKGKISVDAHKKAAHYSIARSRIGLASTLIDNALLLALTLGGGIQRLHSLIANHFISSVSYGIVMVIAIGTLSFIVNLPLSLYTQFVIEERFGFNRMTLALYVVDCVKQVLLSIVFGTPLLAAVFWLMAHMGQLWWLYVWIFWCAFNILMLYIYPNWIAPFFNNFNPLEEPELKARIESLLKRCGFNASGLFVMDGSKRSNHGNAYFTGFGQNKRIVFFDTLISRLTPSEIEAVLAHELGHYKQKHISKKIALTFLLALGALATLGWLLNQTWFFAGLGVSSPNTATGLILFFLASPVFTFPLGPIFSAMSRKHEYEADRYAAEVSSATELSSALVKLYEDNASTLTPDPLHSVFYDSHPPASLRIEHLARLHK